MEIGQVNRLSVLPEPTGATRAPRVPAAPIPTELPPSKVATQVRSSAGTRSSSEAPARSAAADLGFDRERLLTIDPETRQVVSAVYDKRTGDLLSQVPDRALLRLRTYAREIISRFESQRQAARQVEREV